MNKGKSLKFLVELGVLVPSCLVTLNGCNTGESSSSVSLSNSTSASSSNSPSSDAVSSSSSSQSSTSVKEYQIKKETVIVHDSNNTNFNLDVYFKDELKAPYVKLKDLVNNRLSGSGKAGFPIPNYTFSFNSGILTATQSYSGKDYSICFNSNNERIYSDHILDALDLFHTGAINDFTGTDSSPIVKFVKEERTGGNQQTILNLYPYHIDLVPYENDVLIPFVITNSLFFTLGEKNYFYNGHNIYSDYYTESFYTEIPYADANTPFNDETTTFLYNDLCFEMDYFYGRKEALGYSSFNSYFYHINAYEKLTSAFPLKRISGLARMTAAIDDNHTSFVTSSPLAGNARDKEVATTINKAISDGREGLDRTRRTTLTEIKDKLVNQRKATFGNTDTLFEYYNDTCIIRFDNFMRANNSLVFLPNGTLGDVAYDKNTFNLFYDAFNDLKTNHPEVKKILMDESCNTGGDLTTLIELLGFFVEDVKITYKNTLNNEYCETHYKVDTNLDGIYDANDFVAKNYEVYCLTSGSSFSCGNAFPYFLKNNHAATIIGQQSAGGSCIVLPLSTAFGDVFNISGTRVLGVQDENGNFTDNDLGVEVDKLIDLEDFYDYDKLFQNL